MTLGLLYVATQLIIGAAIVGPSYLTIAGAHDRSALCPQGARLLLLVAGVIGLLAGQLGGHLLLEVAT